MKPLAWFALGIVSTSLWWIMTVLLGLIAMGTVKGYSSSTPFWLVVGSLLSGSGMVIFVTEYQHALFKLVVSKAMEESCNQKCNCSKG